MENKRLTWALMAVVSFMLLPNIAAAESPKEWVKTTVAEMQNVLPNNGREEPLTEEQLGKVSRLIDDSFDFPKLARMVLGQHWKKRTSVEQQEFISLFRKLLVQSHVMKAATEAKAEQRFLGEEVEMDRAVVQAVAKVDDAEIPIEYVLVRHDGTWKIYDLGVDGMRLSQIYRSQFNKVISQSSYADLMKRMKMKLEEIAMDQGMSPTSYSRVSSK